MAFKWKEAALVTGAGGVGGALSLVYSITVGKPPVIVLPWGLFAYIFLGMGAAFLGVYLLAKTDTSHLGHCLGFAIACGLSWAPIMDASSALIRENNERELKAQVKKVNYDSESLMAQIEKAQEEEFSEIKKDILGNVSELTSIAKQARSIETIHSANDGITKISNVISKLRERNSKIALSTSNEVSAIIASANNSSAVKIDNPYSIGRNFIFPFDMPAFEMSVGQVAKESNDEVLVIRKQPHEG